ncbi:hypothetical protein KUH03_32335 [Sphingobacterium sp. E70]|uniref:hypothetical protein n=1 Tax=Sphingobacterium sp. E70 TaxID=2853439 RepID=UPI00211C2042|nr:hypothetical protein [Sphingobacterium sp. E70]ULT23789.1 hypothetical protein KUH03_32335 [Sphingobacterium sp. E70]
MHILQFATKTWWASDYNALHNNTKATVNLDCVSDADTLCLFAEDRERVCKEIHEVETFLRWRSNKGYIGLQKRILSLLNNDARSRYEELMLQYPELYNLVPKHLIAAYLGVSVRRSAGSITTNNVIYITKTNHSLKCDVYHIGV